ncbi:MAG TPA: aspartate-semialdehyde dehydrogenase [Bacillota bacterium]|nr:aspartate-semialdehyde dehydrogenase [Bacillota bacterium]
MKKYNVIVVGATGLVGTTLINILEERDFPLKKLLPLASSRSAGKSIDAFGQKFTVEELTADAFSSNYDFAFFCAGGEISKQYAMLSAQKGIVTIDNSSYYRGDDNVPLIVPEVNFDRVKSNNRLIANPNCSTIQCMAPLKVLAHLYRIESINYATYQACSGAGIGGLNDLLNDTALCFDHKISESVLPRIDVFLDNGYSKEEIKMINETAKILELPNVPISATCVRVPITTGHSVAITVELDSEPDIEQVRQTMSEFDGLSVVDDTAKNLYPIAENVRGKDIIEVGRLRQDLFRTNVIHFWTVADNLRKGAATNAIQIAEKFIAKYPESIS